MEIVVETREFRVYGLTDKPLSIGAVGDDHISIAVPETVLKQRLSDIIGSEFPVGFVGAEGERAFPARVSAVEEGAGADEADIIVVFDAADDISSTLSDLGRAFAERFRFTSGGAAPKRQSTVVKQVMADALDDIAKRETGRSGRLAPDGAADGRSVARALAEQLGIGYTDLEASGVDVIKVREFRRDFLLRHLFIPLYESDGLTKIAVVWELAPEAVAAVGRRYGEKVSYSIAPEEQVFSAVEHAFNVSENRRRAARLGVALRVRLGLYDTSWNLIAGPVQGVTRNISAAGMLAASPPLLQDPHHAVGNRIGVLLFLPEYERPLRAVGRVVRASELSAAPPVHLYAVEINHVSDDDRRRLDVFRYTLMWGPHRLRVD